MEHQRLTLPNRRRAALEAVRRRPTLRLSHDEVVAWLCETVDRTRPQTVADGFLIGIADRRPDLCSGLASYAVWRFMRPHAFHGTVSCDTCGGAEGPDVVPLINMTGGRYSGAPWTSWAFYAAFDLDALASEQLRPVTDQDVAVLRSIIETAKTLPANSRASALVKAMLPGRSPGERRSIIEALGYCGILAPRTHARHDVPIPRAAFNAPHQFGVPTRSDWHFPAGAWTSNDGVNTNALAYWFPHAS